MTRVVRFLLIAGLLVFVTGALLITSQRSSSRKSLAAYKAELRAKGEKLTAAELGYPHPLESSDRLDRLQAGLDRLAEGSCHPGSFELLRYVAAGHAQIAWAEANPRFISEAGAIEPLTWQEFSKSFGACADALADIRDATQNPPRWSFVDPTNFVNRPTAPFVLLRAVTKLLATDALVAMHAGEHNRAAADIHALAQLARFYREDAHFVSQMVRASIAWTGLNVTWEALQMPGWSKNELGAVQREWEHLDLWEAFEMGVTSERVQSEAAISFFRSVGIRNAMNLLVGNASSRPSSLRDYFEDLVVTPVWRANAEADELFFLRHFQNCLDSIRKLRRPIPWVTVEEELKQHENSLQQLTANKMAQVRYYFSAFAIPRIQRAARTCARNETQRRLTVAAIAIERYRLRHGQPPPDLDALVPQFLSAVPIDLMSAKPLGYKLNPDGSFTLYSVGEDGRDDGGDPNPASATNKFDLWTGKDAVWPRAVFDTERPSNREQ